MMGRIIPAIAILLAVLGALARGGTPIGTNFVQDGVPVHFECEMPLQQIPATGFFSVRMKIQNGTAQAHTWDVRLRTDRSGRDDPAMAWSTSLTVAAGQSREWDLLVPRAALENAGSGYDFIRGQVEGYAIVRGGSFMLPSRYMGGQPTAFVAMSDSLASSAWSRLETEMRSTTPVAATRNLSLTNNRFPSGRGSARMLCGSSVVLSELPADWRAFSGFGGLWLTQKDWEKLSSERRRAIRTWLNVGGNLFIGGEGDTVEKAPMLPDVIKVGEATPVGLGFVKGFKLDAKELPVTQTVNDILALDAAPFPAWYKDFADDWTLTDFVGWPRLNVALIIGFVCLFGLVIGPVNLRVFAPPLKRYRLFLTVPLISVAASIVLLLAIMIGDGFGGFGARNALVYLPAGENQASIIQEQIARTRLLVGRSFKVPEAVQLASANTKGSFSNVSLSRYGDNASGDWFRSRAVQTLSLRATVPSRAEVTVQSAPADNKPPVLLSSVGAPLKNVFFIDADGKYWWTDVMETGRPATLQAADKVAFDTWKDRASIDLSTQLKSVVAETGARRGYFYAMTDSLPEAPLATLNSINWEKQTVLCFGPCAKGGAQ